MLRNIDEERGMGRGRAAFGKWFMPLHEWFEAFKAIYCGEFVNVTMPVELCKGNRGIELQHIDVRGKRIEIMTCAAKIWNLYLDSLLWGSVL